MSLGTTVSLAYRGGNPASFAFLTTQPEDWTENEPHALVHATYRVLQPNALLRLQLAPCEDACYRLAIACDTGTASTAPLRLSSEALAGCSCGSFRCRLMWRQRKYARSHGRRFRQRRWRGRRVQVTRL